MIIIFLPKDFEFPDTGPITKGDIIAGAIYAILGWSSTYFVVGYLNGYDMMGLKLLSFVLGNFVALLIAMVWWLIQALCKDFYRACRK